jgi:hypothetical protein
VGGVEKGVGERVLPELNTVKDIGRPIEILEVAQGQAAEFICTGIDLGKGVIKPRETGVEKEVLILRLHVKQGDKATSPSYWDVTSTTAIVDLWGILKEPGMLPQRVRMTKVGYGKTGRYTIAMSKP